MSQFEYEIDEIDNEIQQLQTLLAAKNQDSIYEKNRQLARKNVVLSAIYHSKEVSKNLRPHLKKHIMAQRISEEKKTSKLMSKYKQYYLSWRANSSKLNNNSSLLRNNSRRSIASSDVVHSEAQLEKIINLSTQSERFAQEPDMIIDPIIKRNSKFKSTNNLISDPIENLKMYNNDLNMSWSKEDKDLFKQVLGEHGKNFLKISEHFPTKTAQDWLVDTTLLISVFYFYREKNKCGFKSYLKKCERRRRLQNNAQLKKENETILSSRATLLKRSVYQNDDVSSQDGNSSASESHNEHFTLKWEPDVKIKYIEALSIHGRDFTALSEITNKPEQECNLFYEKYQTRLKLNEISLPADLKRLSDLNQDPTSDQWELIHLFVDGNIKSSNEENNHPIDESSDDRKKRKIGSIDKSDEKKLKKRRGKKKLDEIPHPIYINEEFEMTEDMSQIPRRTVSYWSVAEKAEFLRALAKYGRQWEMISKHIGTKSAIQNRNYYQNYKIKLDLDRILQDNGHAFDDEKVNESDDPDQQFMGETEEQKEASVDFIIKPPKYDGDVLSTVPLKPALPLFSHSLNHQPLIHYSKPIFPSPKVPNLASQSSTSVQAEDTLNGGNVSSTEIHTYRKPDGINGSTQEIHTYRRPEGTSPQETHTYRRPEELPPPIQPTVIASFPRPFIYHHPPAYPIYGRDMGFNQEGYSSTPPFMSPYRPHIPMPGPYPPNQNVYPYYRPYTYTTNIHPPQQYSPIPPSIPESNSVSNSSSNNPEETKQPPKEKKSATQE